jgi:lipoate---protein ligase
MIGKSAIKSPVGKLLKASVSFEGDVILSVKLSGDFFIHPEDAIERLEEALVGVKVVEVRRFVERELADARLYGIDRGSIVKAIWEATL